MLTNQPIDPGCSKVLRDTANKEENELTPEQKAIIDRRCAEVEGRLADASLQEWIDASAEINGILSYLRRLGRTQPSPTDVHVLVATKTYQGEVAARIAERFLSRYGCSVLRMETGELSTKDSDEFMDGVAEIGKWCQQTLPGYRSGGYNVVFNLTGGFKAVQGCLTALGMFYADEVVYIFERSENLIVIPHLPIRLDALEEARENALAFGLLSYGDLTADAITAAGVRFDPNTAMFRGLGEGGERLVGLSPWGQVVWDQHRKQVLSEKLLDWPCLTYSDHFKEGFERYSAERAELQERLAEISYVLLESGGNFGKLRGRGGRLGYDKLDRHPGYDHFRVTDNFRVSCRPAEGKLLLCRFGPHDDVNNNPEG